MYSIIVATALSVGGSTPDLGFKGHVASSAGCYSYPGCWGPCYGSGYTGWTYGYGNGYGAWGAGYGSQAAWGHGYGGQVPWGPSVGWDHCGGGCGGYNSPAFGAPYTPVLTTPGTPPRTRPPTKAKDADKGKEKEDDEMAGVSPDRARLVVELPAGAKLYVDDRAVPNNSERRTFTTPELARGKAYFYDLRAEVVKDGKTISETRRVVVRPGGVIRTDFRSIGTGTASVSR
jgi:uncharacterized protein (TIGR03000 family)